MRFGLAVLLLGLGMYARRLWERAELGGTFWEGVAATFAALFVLWFFAAGTVGTPRVVECIKDNRAPAVSAEIESNRKHGYVRTFEVGACTAYWHASSEANDSRAEQIWENERVRERYDGDFYETPADAVPPPPDPDPPPVVRLLWERSWENTRVVRA